MISTITCLEDYYVNATGAINEGYADVFGYFIEGDNDPQWLHREDNMAEGVGKDCKRNMSNPNSVECPSKIGDQYYHDFTGDELEVSYDGGGVHTNSTIVSHACYLMWKNGISDKQRLANLWYRALFYEYNGNSTFTTLRLNTLSAAKDIRMTAEEIEIIKAAFDEVGIEGRTKADIMGTNVLMGKVVQADRDQLLKNNVPLQGIKVALEKIEFENNGIYYSEYYRYDYTAVDGIYSITNIIPGTYNLTISGDNFHTFTEVVTFSATGITTYHATIEMLPEFSTVYAYATGTICASDTSRGVEGLTLLVREGYNKMEGDVIETITTNQSGIYTTSKLDTGYYCIEINDNRILEDGESKYERTHFNVKVYGNDGILYPQNACVFPTIQSGQLSVVLDWHYLTESLFLEVVGLTLDGERMDVTEVYKNVGTARCGYYGSYVFTLDNPNDGTYIFYVYAPYGQNLSESAGCVRIYDSTNGLSYRYDVPVSTTGDWWKVFSYDTKTKKITPINTVETENEYNTTLSEN